MDGYRRGQHARGRAGGKSGTEAGDRPQVTEVAVWRLAKAGKLSRVASRIVSSIEGRSNHQYDTSTWALPARPATGRPFPHGHWKTSTFVAVLRSSGLTAPLVVDAP